MTPATTRSPDSESDLTTSGSPARAGLHAPARSRASEGTTKAGDAECGKKTRAGSKAGSGRKVAQAVSVPSPAVPCSLNPRQAGNGVEHAIVTPIQLLASPSPLASLGSEGDASVHPVLGSPLTFELEDTTSTPVPMKATLAVKQEIPETGNCSMPAPRRSNVNSKSLRAAIKQLGLAPHHRRALLKLAAAKAKLAPHCDKKQSVLDHLIVRA